jgi:outer membrane protein assembly factor BamB
MLKKGLRLISLLLVLSFVLIPGLALAANDWPQFHNDTANTGYSASNAPATADLAWESEEVNATPGSNPAVANGKIFVYGNDRLTCLKEESGETLWQTSLEAAHLWGAWQSPAYANGKVFIGSGKYLYCLAEDSGGELWKYKFPTNRGPCNGSPKVAGGKVIVGDWDGGFYYCLDENSGDFKWKYAVTGNAQGTPAYVDGKVYLTSWSYRTENNAHIYCLNAETGALIWHQGDLTHDDEEGTCGSPTIAEGKVFVTTYNFYGDGKIAALDAAGGDILWQKTTNRTDATPAYAGGKIYICGGCLGFAEPVTTSCFNADTGELIWLKNDKGNWTCSVAVADGKVFVGKPGSTAFSDFDYLETYALNAENGGTIWSYAGGGSSPAVANGRVYTLGGGKVYAFGQLEQEYPDWDVNKDGQVNVLDMIGVGQKFGQTGTPGWIREDVNKDGEINVLDMILIGQHWTG